MNRLENFREIADEIMDDIQVTEELKKKVMVKARKKSNTVRYIMLPAACLILVFVISNLFNNGPLPSPRLQNNQEFSIMATDQAVKDAVWNLDDTEAAEKAFGKELKMHFRLPEGYALKSIQATGPHEGQAEQITFYYEKGQNTLTVLVDKNLIFDSTGFTEVNFRGNTGYFILNGAEAYFHWFQNEVHYTMRGPLTKEKIVEIAETIN